TQSMPWLTALSQLPLVITASRVSPGGIIAAQPSGCNTTCQMQNRFLQLTCIGLTTPALANAASRNPGDCYTWTAHIGNPSIPPFPLRPKTNGIGSPSRP